MRVHPALPATLALVFLPFTQWVHPVNRLFLDPPNNARLALGIVLVLAISGVAAFASVWLLRRRWVQTPQAWRMAVVAEVAVLVLVAALMAFVFVQFDCFEPTSCAPDDGD